MEEVYGVSEIFLPEYSLNIHILHQNHQQYLQVITQSDFTRAGGWVVRSLEKKYKLNASMLFVK